MHPTYPYFQSVIVKSIIVQVMIVQVMIVQVTIVQVTIVQAVNFIPVTRNNSRSSPHL